MQSTKKDIPRLVIMIVSALLAFIVLCFLTDVIESDHLLGAGKYIGLSVFSANCVDWAFCNYPPFWRFYYGVHSFDGRWEGWYVPRFDRQWRPICLEISQRTDIITIDVFVRGNHAKSFAVRVITDENQSTLQLISNIRAGYAPSDDPGARHDGTHVLKLARDANNRPLLDGFYFTDRLNEDKTRGSNGHIRVVEVKSQRSGLLEFVSESLWGMKKPDHDPFECDRI